MLTRNLWIAWIVLIEVVFVLCLLPVNRIHNIINTESELISQYVGVEQAQWVNSTARTMYQKSFAEPGVYEALHRSFIPDKQYENDALYEAPWFEYVENRIKTLSAVVWWFFTRLAVTLSWAPFILILAIPAIYDGVAMWRAKRYGFGYSSPVAFTMLSSTALIIVGGLAMVMIAPVVIHPLLFPMALICLAVLMNVAIRNMAKRI